MDFLKNKPVLAKLSGGFQDTFISDILDRKPQQDTLGVFNQWVPMVQKQMLTVKARKNCPLVWAGIFIDEQGIVLITQFARGLQICNAKATVRLLVNFMGKQMQDHTMSNMRQLDELDYRRINAWLTPTSLYPFKLQRKRKAPAEQPPANDGPPPKRSRQQLLLDIAKLAEADDDEEEGEEEAPPMPQLRIQNDNNRCAIEHVAHTSSALENVVCTSSALEDIARTSSDELLANPKLLWLFRTIEKATIVVVEVGNRPVLNYVKCLHETRRVMLLTHAVREEYDRFSMVAVMRVAAGLSNAGAIPSHVGGPKAPKSDFVKRCAAALKALDENAECDLTKLAAKDQKSVCALLGGKEEPFDGCFADSCLDKTPMWVAPYKTMVRCGHCNTPMSFGRTWTTGRDLVKHEMNRLGMEVTNDTWRSQNLPKPLPSAPESWFGDD